MLPAKPSRVSTMSLDTRPPHDRPHLKANNPTKSRLLQKSFA
jgi:hypothetical protein